MISRETLLVYSTRLRRKHTRNWPKIHVGGPIVILQLLFHFLQLLFPFLLASWPWPPLLPVLILLLLCTRVQSLSWHSSSSTSSRKLVLASHDILPPRAMVWTWDPFQMKTSSCHALKRKRCQLNQSANLPNYNCPVTSSSSQQPEPPELQLSQALLHSSQNLPNCNCHKSCLPLFTDVELYLYLYYRRACNNRQLVNCKILQ